MFAAPFFAPRFFAARYWAEVGSGATIVVTSIPARKRWFPGLGRRVRRPR